MVSIRIKCDDPKPFRAAYPGVPAFWDGAVLHVEADGATAAKIKTDERFAFLIQSE